MVSIRRAKTTVPLSRHLRSRGFTLVELVMVAVIIAIIASIAAPQLGRAAARQRLEAATRRVVVDIKYAKQLAHTTSRSHRVRFLPNTNSYTIDRTTYGLTWNPIKGMDRLAVGYSVDLASEPYVAKVSTGTAVSFEYDGYGQPVSNASIVIAVGSQAKQIQMDSATGEISVSDYTLGNGAKAGKH